MPSLSADDDGMIVSTAPIQSAVNLYPHARQHSAIPYKLTPFGDNFLFRFLIASL